MQLAHSGKREQQNFAAIGRHDRDGVGERQASEHRASAVFQSSRDAVPVRRREQVAYWCPCGPNPGAETVDSEGKGSPRSAAQIGTASVRKATTAASGLPGRPTSSRPSPSRARLCGCPGRQSTRSMSIVPPRLRSDRRSWSAGPTDDEPDTNNSCPGDDSTARTRSFSVSAAYSVATSSPPHEATNPGSNGPIASRTQPSSGMPCVRTSSPLMTTPTVGLARTHSRSYPTAAANPCTCAETTVPAGRRCSPRWHSSPARRMFSPAATGPVSDRPQSWAYSYGSTAVVSAGMTAPVAISYACPDSSGGGAG